MFIYRPIWCPGISKDYPVGTEFTTQKETSLSLLAGKATSPTLAEKITYFRGEGACLKSSWNYMCLSKQPLSWISPPFPLSLSPLSFSILFFSFFNKLHIFYPFLAKLSFLRCWLSADSVPPAGRTCSFCFCLTQTSWLRRSRSNENYDWDPSHCSISIYCTACFSCSNLQS